jgi:hypothetical protein
VVSEDRRGGDSPLTRSGGRYGAAGRERPRVGRSLMRGAGSLERGGNSPEGTPNPRARRRFRGAMPAPRARRRFARGVPRLVFDGSLRLFGPWAFSLPWIAAMRSVICSYEFYRLLFLKRVDFLLLGDPYGCPPHICCYLYERDKLHEIKILNIMIIIFISYIYTSKVIILSNNVLTNFKNNIS